MKKKQTNNKKAVETTNELKVILERKENKKKETPKFTVEDILNRIPEAKINRRKDGFIKFYEACCYIKNMTYGVQFRDSVSGAPTGLLSRIETPEDLEHYVEIIKNRIKKYKPQSKSVKRTNPDEDVAISIKVATRNKIYKIKQPGESYDKLLNRLIDHLNG